MRFGCYTELENAKLIQDIGYDYIELPVSVVKPEASDSDFDAVWEIFDGLEIVPEVWCRLLPRDMQIVGPDVDIYRVERYLRTAFERIEKLGGEIVVFGCGNSRHIPPNFPEDEAKEQLVEFITLAGQIAGSFGLNVGVEPLNPKETNIINSVHEAAELVRKVDHPFVKVVADLYHMSEVGESMQSLIEAGNDLIHTHVSDGERLYPGSGIYLIREFIETLRSMGYNDRMSVECNFRNLADECKKSLEYLRKLDEEIPY